MNDTTPRRRHPLLNRLRSRRLRAGLGLGVALSLGVVGTHAFWTDDVTVTGATFTAGTIDLKVNGGDTNVSLTSLSLVNMRPGESTAGILTVQNAGAVPLKYSAAGVATNLDGKGFAAALVVKVTGATSVTGTGSARTCGGTALPGTGTSLNGALVSTARLLAAGASEDLCVSVALSPTAPNALQGATTSATFTFTGTSDLS